MFRPAGGARFVGGASFGFTRADVVAMSLDEFNDHLEALATLRGDETVALESGSVQGEEG